MTQAVAMHPSAGWADGLSTGLYVAGLEEGKAIAQREGLAILLMSASGEIFRSETFRRMEAQGVAVR